MWGSDERSELRKVTDQDDGWNSHYFHGRFAAQFAPHFAPHAQASIAEPPLLFNLGLDDSPGKPQKSSNRGNSGCNRLFYFAIPANVFASAGNAIKSKCMSRGDGWTRIIVEKPFGHDLESCNELTQALAKNFDERHLYR